MSSGDYLEKFLRLVKEKNILSWSIESNEHKNFYESVEEYYGEREDSFDFIDYDKCKELNQVYCVGWYPRTPISFYAIYGSNLEDVIKEALEVMGDANS